MPSSGIKAILIYLIFEVLLVPAGVALGKPVIEPSSHSPDGEYGVTAFANASEAVAAGDDGNKLVNLYTGKIVGLIDAEPSMTRMNRGGILPARWSSDSSLLLWEAEGRWSPCALVLVKIKEGKIEWQRDLLKIAQKAILVRTRKAAPGKYAAAKKWNAGSGSAFPDGFTVNVRAEGDKPRGGSGEAVRGEPVSLPLKVHAELTSNPKGLDCPKGAELDSELDGDVNQRGEFSVSHFRLRDSPSSYGLSSSWLELTNPSAAALAIPEYGDDVSLEGTIITRKDASGKSAYVLVLKQKLSIKASFGQKAENDVAEVQLLGFDLWPIPETLKNGGKLDVGAVSGMLWHAQGSNGLPPVTLKVQGYGYGS